MCEKTIFMKKSRNGKRYFVLKNRIAYFMWHRQKNFIAVVPTIGFCWSGGLGAARKIECVSFYLFVWRLDLVFEDKKFAPFI